MVSHSKEIKLMKLLESAKLIGWDHNLISSGFLTNTNRFFEILKTNRKTYFSVRWRHTVLTAFINN
jgi:hypothetical protein